MAAEFGPTSLMDGPRTTPPEPLARSNSYDLAIDLRHPTPDLQSLQGAYVGNIERLEEHAERMSSSGSELGEEIRRLQLEQKLSDSRKSSLVSHSADPAVPNRSRNTSTSSYGNSIVDLNNNARWGGYSPGGYVGSPLGSIRSGSWSQPSVKRQISSASKGSRLGMLNDREGGNFLDEDTQMSSESRTDTATVQGAEGDQNTHTRDAGDIEAMETQDEASEHNGEERRPHSQGHDSRSRDSEDYADRPSTSGSTDTYQQAKILFHDFDGVHYTPGNVEGSEFGPSSRQSSMLRALSHHTPHVPPPGDNMVYYPAPVPRMLNLPKRLSQMPSAAVQAKRRTQMLGELAPEATKSAKWLNEDNGSTSDVKKGNDSQKTRMGAANLPPQLRATLFFDKQPVSQEVEVKGESAVATLDSILEASALAPVSAFTDHPFAGRIGNEVYGKEKSKKSTASTLNIEQAASRKSRSSLNLLRRKSASSTDQLTKPIEPNTSLIRDCNCGPNCDHVLHEEVDQTGEHTPLRQSLDDEGNIIEEGSEPEVDSEPQFVGPPTTLLAELQMRKQQQKTRNRTAATAFPNGMHATLLELDAVAEVEKERRKGHRVALAWEDPEITAAEAAEEDDDDVPLGMLFPGKSGLMNKKLGQADWDRPLGLIEKREIEDNEPLSRRRNRLKGIDPNLRQPSPLKESLPVGGTDAAQPEDEEDDGETLAQRLRRLKDQEALNSALGDISTRPVSGDFASEMLSQLGGPLADEAPSPAAKPNNEEEETLGQRRARLQAEGRQLRASNANTSQSTRPPLRQSHSMAELLSMHPSGHVANKVSNDMLLSSLPAGSLLQKSERTRTRHKQEILEQNRRSVLYGVEKPLVNVQAQPNHFKNGGLVGTPNQFPVYNPMNSSMNVNMNMGMNMSMNSLPAQQAGMSFPGAAQMYTNMSPVPQMGLGFPPNGNMMGGFPPPQQQFGAMGAFGGINGMNGMGGMGAFGFQHAAQAQQMPMDLMMDPRQRDMIDRWRQSIAP